MCLRLPEISDDESSAGNVSEEELQVKREDAKGKGKAKIESEPAEELKVESEDEDDEDVAADEYVRSLVENKPS